MSKLYLCQFFNCLKFFNINSSNFKILIYQKKWTLDIFIYSFTIKGKINANYFSYVVVYIFQSQIHHTFILKLLNKHKKRNKNYKKSKMSWHKIELKYPKKKTIIFAKPFFGHSKFLFFFGLYKDYCKYNITYLVVFWV